MSITDRSFHTRRGRPLAISAGAGVALVLPFALLEWRANGGFPVGVPIALYAALWLLAAAGCLLAWSAMRGRSVSRRGTALLGALLVAALWLSLVRDQWPCFVGVPNCD